MEKFDVLIGYKYGRDGKADLQFIKSNRVVF